MLRCAKSDGVCTGADTVILNGMGGGGGGGIVHVTVSNHINYSTKHEKGRGGRVRTIHYSTNTDSWDGRGSRPYITVLIPILGMGGGSRPYITVLLINSWDGRGVRIINYSTINQFLGWEGGPDHKLQYYYQSLGWEGPDHKLQYYYQSLGARP